MFIMVNSNKSSAYLKTNANNITRNDFIKYIEFGEIREWKTKRKSRELFISKRSASKNFYFAKGFHSLLEFSVRELFEAMDSVG